MTSYLSAGEELVRSIRAVKISTISLGSRGRIVADTSSSNCFGSRGRIAADTSNNFGSRGRIVASRGMDRII